MDVSTVALIFGVPVYIAITICLFDWSGGERSLGEWAWWPVIMIKALAVGLWRAISN